MSLRLNYILWIEDLLKYSGIVDMSSVNGLDIGTGAMCIYPLLLCKMYGCKMDCTEIDQESLDAAENNVQQNQFQNFINVMLVKEESILKEILREDSSYSFVMCNPPFFESNREHGKKTKHTPPRNAPTGNSTELEVDGGERKFILRLIDESMQNKTQVKIYTAMLGQKSRLSFLRAALVERGISNFTWTEFCQGYTKRWGIAWTYATASEINLTTALVTRTRTEALKSKDNRSMEIVIPPSKKLGSMKEVVASLNGWIDELNIQSKLMDMDPDHRSCFACQVTAYQDTWTHARRRRRLAAN